MNTIQMDDTTMSEPTVTESVMTEVSPYIVTLDELLSTQGAITQKEANDKQSLLDVFQPDTNVLKLRLLIWASVGFPSDWVVFTAKTDPPVVCSDGQARPYYEYVQYLLGKPIQPFLDTLNSQVLGVSFNFFLRDINTIGLNVSRV